MRLKLTVEYDGTGFRGWARQPGERTVEGELRRALGRALRRRGRPRGRREDGHGRARARECRLGRRGRRPAARAGRGGAERGAARRRRGRSVRSRRRTTSTRGSTRAPRSYRYRVWRRRERSALEARRALWWPRPFDVAAADASAQALLGEHDFRAFTPTETRHQVFVRVVEAGAVGASSTRTSPRSRSPPTRSCATWCGRSWGRCSRAATSRRSSRAARGARPAPPHRRTACTSRTCPTEPCPGTVPGDMRLDPGDRRVRGENVKREDVPRMRERRRGQVPLLPVVRRAAAAEARRVLRAASGGRRRRAEGASRVPLLRRRRDRAAGPLQHLVGRRRRGRGLALAGGGRARRRVPGTAGAAAPR